MAGGPNAPAGSILAKRHGKVTSYVMPNDKPAVLAALLEDAGEDAEFLAYKNTVHGSDEEYWFAQGVDSVRESTLAALLEDHTHWWAKETEDGRIIWDEGNPTVKESPDFDGVAIYVPRLPIREEGGK